MRLSVEWHLPFRSLPMPCAPDHISCRSIVVPGRPFVEFAASDGRGGFEEFRPIPIQPPVPVFSIDTSAFVESLNRMVDEMGDELRRVAGRAVQDRIEAMHRGAPFGLLRPHRPGIVAAFENRYQRAATPAEGATLLGRSPRELEAMRQALLPVEEFPAEQRVDPDTKQRLRAAEVEALICEFEPEL